jgi:hypothetical protein
MQTPTGHASLIYEEPLDAPLPTHLDEIAATLWVGFRFLSPPEAAIENVIVGKTRLPQFRDAKRSEITRQLRLHFKAARPVYEGESLRLGDWIAKWRGDATLRRLVKAHPAYASWMAGLAERFRDERLVAVAEEDTRSCYGRLGGDPASLKAMHEFMEEGDI